ncbi:MAG: alpha-galactosidase [Clostridia bacterium]|nr:alpha-galactosidase [Clostridia bacterium]
MSKIAFIGAGSFTFTRNLVNDLLTFPAFQDAEFCLMDIDEERLMGIEKVCRRLVEASGNGAKVTATMSRAEALEGADGVLCTVFNGDLDIWRGDLEIPKKYGVDTNIGDTRSVAGIFRALRNIPLMLDICKDIEKYCPNAVFLNYTNPMSMLCKAMQTHTKVDVTGLCHSVQHTVQLLANWMEMPVEDIDYLCAGVNHQAFYLKLEHNKKSLYPRLREALQKEELYNQEIVRNNMFLNLDYYVTESSGHNSEYNQWYRKRPDLIEKYCLPGTGWNPGEYGFSIQSRITRLANWKSDWETWLNENPAETYKFEKTVEYASNIFNARFGDLTPCQFNGNVINEGCIPNLPYDACVEIPVIADRAGFHKMYVGNLPDHLAILVNTTARMENLVVEAAMEKDKRKVYHAVCMDPLTGAVCSLDEIKQMVDELFAFNKDFLGDYK